MLGSPTIMVFINTTEWKGDRGALYSLLQWKYRPCESPLERKTLLCTSTFDQREEICKFYTAAKMYITQKSPYAMTFSILGIRVAIILFYRKLWNMRMFSCTK